MKKKEILKNTTIFLIPTLILLILFFAYYPGIITYDSNNQWQQIVNNYITDAHPFFTTFFMLLLSKIWFSPSVVILFQIFIFSLFWTIICNYTRKEKNDFKKQIIYTIIISFLPINSIYAITLWKDILYSYYLLLLSFFLYLGSKKKYNYTKIQLLIITLLLFLVFNYRHNGKIVAILLIILLFIIMIKNKISIKKVLIIPVIFTATILFLQVPKELIVKPNLEIDGSKSQMSTIDGLLVWMIGSFVTENKIEDIDKPFLNNIIEIDKWKNIYNPYLINETTNSNLINKKFVSLHSNDIKTIWFKYSFKYPLTIFKHYLKADSLLWNPYPKGYVYIYGFSEWAPNYGFDAITSSKFPIIKKYYSKVINISMKRLIKPIIYQPATTMYFSLIILYLLSKLLKSKRVFIVAIPMLFNAISLVPINVAQDLRYVYINYLTLEFSILLFILEFYRIKIILKRKKEAIQQCK